MKYKEKIIVGETCFDPVSAKQEFLKQLLNVRYETLQNIKKTKHQILESDTEMRAKNIPYSERQFDLHKLIQCEKWIGWLEQVEFSHMLINCWAVEFWDDLKMEEKAKKEALYYFDWYTM